MDQVTPSINNLISAISRHGRKQILRYGGRELLRQTKANFGATGPYREKAWPPLSKNYAKKVGSSVPTELRSGELKNSIMLSAPRDNIIELYTTNPYAAAQAFGYKPRNLPARNYFPIQNMGKPTYSRLVYSAEKDLFKAITSQLTALSKGAFPLQSTPTNRMTPEYGNPFTGPTNVSNP